MTRQFQLPNGEWRTLDNSAQRRVALEDPAGFVQRRSAGTMVIDEVQKAAVFLPEIKRIVDENKSKGQYLLTGSADIKKLPAVTESLAGRMGTIRLRTLAHGEIAGNEPTFLRRAFAQEFPSVLKGYSKRDVLSYAFRGGLVKGKSFTGIVLYTGEVALPFGKGLYAVPMGAICA